MAFSKSDPILTVRINGLARPGYQYWIESEVKVPLFCTLDVLVEKLKHSGPEPLPHGFRSDDDAGFMRAKPLAVSTQGPQPVLVTDGASCYDQNSTLGLRINRKETFAYFLDKVEIRNHTSRWRSKGMTVQLAWCEDDEHIHESFKITSTAESYNVPSGHDVYICNGDKSDRLKNTHWRKTLLREVLPYMPTPAVINGGYNGLQTITAVYRRAVNFSYSQPFLGINGFRKIRIPCNGLFTPFMTVHELNEFVKKESKGEFELKMLRGFRNGRAYEGKKELWAEGILGTRLQSTSQNEWSDEFVEWPTVKVKRTQKLEGPATVVPQLNLPLAWIGQGNQTVKYPFEPPSERVEELDVNAVRISEVECFVPWFH